MPPPPKPTQASPPQAVRRKTFFDGTKLPMVDECLQNHYPWYECPKNRRKTSPLFPPFRAARRIVHHAPTHTCGFPSPLFICSPFPCRKGARGIGHLGSSTHFRSPFPLWEGVRG